MGSVMLIDLFDIWAGAYVKSDANPVCLIKIRIPFSVAV